MTVGQVAGVLTGGPTPEVWLEHASAEEYAELINAVTSDRSYLLLKLKHRRDFVQRYPDLGAWFAEPLVKRVGRLVGEDPRRGR